MDPKPKTVAISVADSEFSQTVAIGAREWAKKYGLTISYDRSFPANTVDFAPIVRAIQASNPDIVYVGLGSPKQEFLIDRIRRCLPGAWWLGVGISFSYVSGDVRQAPPWLRRAGMEWAYRMAQEPRRLVGRYLVQGLPFAAALTARSLAATWRR